MTPLGDDGGDGRGCGESLVLWGERGEEFGGERGDVGEAGEER